MELTASRSLESVLFAHPSVLDCVVVERPAAPGAVADLATYVVLGSRVGPDELRTFAAERLPADAQRAVFISVSALPLTPEGDVDLARLAQWEIADDALAARWDATVGALDAVAEVATLVHDRPRRVRHLHLGQLLRDWHVDGDLSSAATPESRPAVGVDTVTSRVPACAHGGPLPATAGTASPLGEWLQRAAIIGRHGLVYIEADGTEWQQSYGGLLVQAQRIVAGLRRAGLSPGDRVLLQCQRLDDFLETFWACVLGGFIPVPLAVPPRYDAPSGPLDTIWGAWDMLDHPAIVTARASIDALTHATEGLTPVARLFAVEDLRLEPDHQFHRCSPDDLALFMLTSGSTGAPKAVTLSHRNLWTRTAGSCQINGFSQDDTSLNWMPLDHVGGLILCHLRDIFVACRQVLVATSHVLHDPLRWLDYLERYRATVTFAPNFAFGLINDHRANLGSRRRDLSSVRALVNGGEAIVARTARRFLQLLEPYGLNPTAMRPAWGMSETSSGITYSDRFSCDRTSDDDPFVEVGRPLPEVALRIVNASGELLSEGVVGRLQVRGPMVTAGYYRNPELTQKAFTSDGWFITGDLAFIRDGQLTVTGREKDVVIVNGVNYPCHMIESAVEELPGVEPSYTAACAVRDPGADTDRLALFFHSRLDDDDQLAELFTRVRSELTRRLGINPHYLVHVAPGDIPKTSLGKIQRTELSRRLLAGEFNGALRHADLIAGNANTLPDWFFRKTWRKRRLLRHDSAASERRDVLILADAEGVGAEIHRCLVARGHRCVVVTAGGSYSRHDGDRFSIDPRAPEDLIDLVNELSREGRLPTHVVHLWDYGRYRPDASLEIEAAQQRGAISLIRLVRALASVPHTAPTKVFVVGSHLHRVAENDPVAYEKTPVLGIVNSVPQELPWLECRHIDAYDVNPARAAQVVLGEFDAVRRDRVVAYRGGERYIPGLERVRFDADASGDPLFKSGGVYLLTGGAGGVGARLATMLAERFHAHLLLIGRRAPDAETRSLVEMLERAGGDATYAQVDVCDEDSLADIVAAHERRWSRSLDGVIHLAGLYDQQLTVDQSEDGFLHVLRPKAIGMAVLHRIMSARDGGFIMSSSSVAGGARIGAYAAANAFLDAFADHHRGRAPVAHYAVAWSQWQGVGLSRDDQVRDAASIRGSLPITPERGVQSLLVATVVRVPVLLVGLDAAHPFVRRQLQDGASPLTRTTVYYTTTRRAAIDVAGLDVRDRFGRGSVPEVVRLLDMPRRPDGSIDRDRLASYGAPQGRNGRGAEPETDIERRLAELWASLLSLPEASLDDSFFASGGDSLQAVRLLGRIREAFGVDLPVRAIFDTDTLKDLAGLIARALPSPASSARAPKTAAADSPTDELLAHLGELSERDIDGLLREFEQQDDRLDAVPPRSS